MFVPCYLCKTSSADCINSLKIHYKFKHRKNDNSNYLCGYAKCNGVSYRNWSGIRKHLKNVHKVPNNPPGTLLCDINQSFMEVQEPVPSKSDFDKTCECINDEHDYDGHDEQEQGKESDCDFERNTVNPGDTLKYLLISFMCKMYDDPVMPRNRVQTIMEETCSIVLNVLSVVQENVSEILCHSDVDSNTASKVNVSVNNFFETVESSCSEFSSEHLRFKLLKEKGFWVDRIEFPIESVVSNVTCGNHVVVKMKYVSGQVLSMKQTLKNFLELPNVYSTICEVLNSTCPDGTIDHYVHSPHWQKKKLNFGDKFVVPLTMYYDEVQTDKPNSNHSAEEGAVYYSVAALPFEFQSLIKNIFTACLFNAQDKKDFGNSKVFYEVIEQVNDLQSHGVSVVTSVGEVNVYFTVGLFVGDNLALHSLFGFVQGFTANYPCRTCHVSKFEMQSMRFEDSSLLRDPVQHAADILENNVTNTGVNERSALCDLQFFDPLDNPSGDLLHDVWGGGVLYDMQHILYHCVHVAKYFSVDVLNFRIMTFQFVIGSNRVPQFSVDAISKKHLRLTGSEMVALVFSFSMLVGDLVSNPSDPVWIFYLTLRKMLDILVMRYVRLNCLHLLRVLVAEHHELYVKLFNDPLKPKHHYWVHFASFLAAVGALISLSTVRFEGRHQPHVQTARSTRSRRNISLTLTIKEQLRLAHRFISGEGFEQSMSYGSIIQTSLVDKYECLKGAIKYKYVKYNGIVYEDNVCVIVDVTDDGIPMFAIIKHVFVKDNNLLFLCHFLETNHFSSHMHAYVVKLKSKRLSVVMLKDLFDPFSVMLTNSCDGNKYVTLRTAAL